MFYYQMSQPSSRPELGTLRYKQPFSTDHEFIHMCRDIGTYNIKCNKLHIICIYSIKYSEITQKIFKMSINCTFLLDLISEYTSKLEECTGYGITLVEEMEKGMIDMSLFPNCNETGYNAIMLEHSLFKVGSIPNLTKGIFYMLLSCSERDSEGNKFFLLYVSNVIATIVAQELRF